MPDIRFFLRPLPGADLDDLLGGPQLAYDVEVLHQAATAGDYLTALEAFQQQVMADCKGCDGCCHERAPLTIMDWQLSGKAGEQGDLATGLGGWLEQHAQLGFFGPAVDLTLRRTAEGACAFLQQQKKYCTVHQQRSFTCRSHCCLPKTERAEALRAALINAGEDELVRRILQLGINPWRDNRLAACQLADYAENGFSRREPEDWASAPLQEICPPELWAEIYRPPSPAAE